MTKLNSEHWSNYWEKGTITTFYKKFSGNYDGEIKAHWDSVFKDINNDSCIVDLCTGNGALLSLLDNYATDNNISFKAYGIDFAKLNPKITDKIKSLNIVLKENTGIENTGLKDNSVDLAISQYGIEYANIDGTVKELDRILKADAKVSFIMHEEKSQIIVDAYQSLKQIDLVNNELKISTIIKEILPAIEGLKKTGKAKYKNKADKLRGKLNNAIQVIMEFAETIPDPGYIEFFYKQALSVFQGEVARNYSLQQKLDVLSQVKVETANLKLRMDDVTSVAMTEETNEKLIKALKSIGFKNVEITPFWYNNAILGQVLNAERES
jgi:ubiquinone/menaquinone biosynthesis C-methylase UbiE